MPASTVPPPAAVADPAGDRSLRRVWACAAAAALPALVLAATSVGADWAPVADYGPLEVRVRDVFSTHPPLVGAFSRLGANHPGPAPFYVLAVPYRLLGSHPWALLAGAALVNAACLALAVRIAGRQGRVGAAVLVSALALACTSRLEVDFLRDPWNPHLALAPFLLAVVATWAVATGSRRSLPVAAAAASFCLQAHVGYALLVAVLAGWWVAGVVRHRHQGRAWRRPLVATAVVLGVMWALPVAQHAVGDEGNLGRIVAEAGLEGDEPRLGWRGVHDLLLPHLALTPAWYPWSPADPFELGGRTGGSPPPLALVVVAATAVVAIRRRDRDALVLLALAGSVWVAAAVSIGRLQGVPVQYLFRWVRVCGILLWWATSWPLGRALLAGARRAAAARARQATVVRRGAPMVVGTALAVMALAVAARGTDAPFSPRHDWEVGAGDLATQVREAVDASPGPTGVIQVAWAGPVTFGVPAVIAELERHGAHVLVDSGGGPGWGFTRVPGRVRPDLVVAITTDLRAAPPGGHRVAVVPGVGINGETAIAWVVADPD